MEKLATRSHPPRAVARCGRAGALDVRRFMNELVRASLPKVTVLSYNEVIPARAVETAGVVRMED